VTAPGPLPFNNDANRAAVKWRPPENRQEAGRRNALRCRILDRNGDPPDPEREAQLAGAQLATPARPDSAPCIQIERRPRVGTAQCSGADVVDSQDQPEIRDRA
jgi:hypothetical protein